MNPSESIDLLNSKLCIDGRGDESASSGLIAHEVIHQLLKSARAAEMSAEWPAQPSTLVLTHPDQQFNASDFHELERRDTKRRVGRSPLYWFWEKNFIRNAGIGAFHRFRPVDRLNPPLSCETLTTLLPPKQSLPFFISRRSNHRYVVPSRVDARLLTKQYHIDPDQIFTVSPAARSFIHEIRFSPVDEEASLLFLLGEPTQRRTMERLREVFSDRYPNLAQVTVPLKRSASFAPIPWVKLLQRAKLCIYLTELPFDWPTLALETLFWEIPTLFLDRHSCLNEMLPKSSLRLSHFLVSLPDINEMREEVHLAKDRLSNLGAFDPDSLARQYRRLYPVPPDRYL